MSKQQSLPNLNPSKGTWVKAKNFLGKGNKVNLTSFPTRKMFCPVTGKKEKCYYIPLGMINSSEMNPMRPGGTPSQNITEIMEDLVAIPEGQIEPGCLEWNATTDQFDKVFSFNRFRAICQADEKGLQIANTPTPDGGGMWAWVFSGTPAEKTRLRIRENGNKRPGKSATKGEIVKGFLKYISEGGCDQALNPEPGNILDHTAFSLLTDKEKRARAKEHLKEMAPQWGGRKFTGIWNAMTRNNGGTTQGFGIGASYKTWDKSVMQKFACAHASKNGCNGLANVTEIESGFVVTDRNKKKTAYYFVNNYKEHHGALPTNATKKKVKENVDEVVVIACFNDASVATFATKRSDFADELRWWNNNIKKVFTKVLYMSADDTEMTTFHNVGKFAKEVIL